MADSIPKLLEKLDPARLRSMAQVERLVVSNVDGATPVGTIAEVTGLPPATVIATLSRLVAMGLVGITAAPEPKAAPARAERAYSSIAREDPPSSRPPPSSRSSKKPSSRPPKLTPSSRPATVPPRPNLSSPRPPPFAPRVSIPRDEPTGDPPVHERTSPRLQPAAPRVTLPRDEPSGERPAPDRASPRLQPAAPRAMIPRDEAPSDPPPRSEIPREWPAEMNTAVSATIAETVDLDIVQQQHITRLHAKLGRLDHYTLLGISRDADKKAVKAAYFGATTKFHPDRYFRKKLGSFKFKMEAIFAQMTEAHDTLTSKDRRTQYDEYLAVRGQASELEEGLASANEALERARREAEKNVTVSSIPPAPSSSSSVGSTRPSSVPPPPPSSSSLSVSRAGAMPSPPPPPPPSAPASASASSLIPKPPTSAPNVDSILNEGMQSKPRISVLPGAPNNNAADQARREMLAKRLMGNRSAPAPPKVPSMQTIPGAPKSSSDAMEQLKRRHEEKLTLARGSQSTKYAQAGAEAKAKGDVVAAANAYRVAASFAPDDAPLQVLAQEAALAADAHLADAYRKTAEYEENAEHWAEAAKSWVKVTRGRPNEAKCHDRAAACTLKANGDLHAASTMAQRAVQLDQKNAGYRLTLANVYLAAGLAKNARRELEAAAQLAPDDPNIQTLLKRAQKAT